MKKEYISRRKTPWDEQSSMTPTQRFLSDQYDSHYQERHPLLKDTGESELINTVIPNTCPYCGEDSFRHYGQTKNGVKRYRCKTCGRTFTPVTGTIFDGHKISISEWTEYCLNLFRYLSVTTDSWNIRNAFTTSRYWLEKLFLILDGYETDIILDGRVWFDETFYTVRSENLKYKPDGRKPRGLSDNQICVGVACTKDTTLCVIEGNGQPTARKAYMAFKDHIAPGSTLVHDNGKAHRLLISELHLEDESYNADEIKNLPDKDNPLDRVNKVHARLKNFLHAHNSFNRDSMQGYLNLFSFAMNPPFDHLEKVDILLNRALLTRKTLRYRDFYNMF